MVRYDEETPSNSHLYYESVHEREEEAVRGEEVDPPAGPEGEVADGVAAGTANLDEPTNEDTEDLSGEDFYK